MFFNQCLKKTFDLFIVVSIPEPPCKVELVPNDWKCLFFRNWQSYLAVSTNVPLNMTHPLGWIFYSHVHFVWRGLVSWQENSLDQQCVETQAEVCVWLCLKFCGDRKPEIGVVVQSLQNSKNVPPLTSWQEHVMFQSKYLKSFYM